MRYSEMFEENSRLFAINPSFYERAFIEMFNVAFRFLNQFKTILNSRIIQYLQGENSLYSMKFENLLFDH